MEILYFSEGSQYYQFPNCFFKGSSQSLISEALACGPTIVVVYGPHNKHRFIAFQPGSIQWITVDFDARIPEDLSECHSICHVASTLLALLPSHSCPPLFAFLTEEVLDRKKCMGFTVRLKPKPSLQWQINHFIILSPFLCMWHVMCVCICYYFIGKSRGEG